MADVAKTVLINQSAERMYDLVTDVSRYPEFLPWCGGVEIFQSTPEIMEAKIHIKYKGIEQYFHTINAQERPLKIDMKFIDGPFKRFEGHWRFIPLREDACKIEFHLSYEFSNFFMEKLIGPVFSIIAGTFVNGFVKRSEEIYD